MTEQDAYYIEQGKLPQLAFKCGARLEHAADCGDREPTARGTTPEPVRLYGRGHLNR